MTEENPPFIYPIPFQKFVEYQRKEQEKENTIFHELHKLKKLRKMLLETEHKIENRIKLFKKVSSEILRKKEKQKEQQIKRQQLRRSPCFVIKSQNKVSFPTHHRDAANCHQPPELPSAKHRYKSTNNEYLLKAPQINLTEAKIQKAKNIKMEKIKYRMLIQQNKKKELRKKMQSAGVIRKDHGRAKMIRQQIERERQDSILKRRKQKYLQEQEQYDTLKKNLTRLQLEEKQALIKWKKTVVHDSS